MPKNQKPAAKKTIGELRNMPRKEGVMQETKTFKGKKPVPTPMAKELKRKK